MRRVCAVLALVPLLGCSWVSASPADYAAYRQTRLAPTFEARLQAAESYLAEHPSGAYRADVSAYVAKAEPVFYRSSGGSIAGLESYLRALPKGAHASEVQSRIRALREQAARPDALVLAAEATEERLAKAAASREKARSELGFWIDVLSDRDVYRTPLSEGPVELITAFSLALPPPRCRVQPSGASSCEKDISVDFMVPTSRGLEDRELGFVITIEKDESGRPTSARVEGEEMFSRLEETYAKKTIDSEGVRDRIAAIERAVDVVSTAFDARVSAELSCRQQVVAPDILHLSCAGMRVVARAAQEAGGMDVVMLSPLPAR